MLILSIALVVAGFWYGRKKNLSVLSLEGDKVNEFLLLGKTLREEKSSGHIVGYLRNGDVIKFEILLNEWVHLAEKSRIMLVERSFNHMEVLCQIYEDAPILEHKHPMISEGIKMLKGSARLMIDGHPVILNAGDSHNIDQDVFHSLEALPDEDGFIFAEYVASWP